MHYHRRSFRLILFNWWFGYPTWNCSFYLHFDVIPFLSAFLPFIHSTYHSISDRSVFNYSTDSLFLDYRFLLWNTLPMIYTTAIYVHTFVLLHYVYYVHFLLEVFTVITYYLHFDFYTFYILFPAFLFTITLSILPISITICWRCILSIVPFHSFDDAVDHYIHSVHSSWSSMIDTFHSHSTDTTIPTTFPSLSGTLHFCSDTIVLFCSFRYR